MSSAVTLTTVNLQEVFNLIDKNGRGQIEINKIGDLLRYAGLNPTERTCNQIIGKYKYWMSGIILLFREVE